MDRIQRQQHTVNLMISIYCRSHHQPPSGTTWNPLKPFGTTWNPLKPSGTLWNPLKPSGTLCPECQQLQTYATERLTHCRYGNHKPTCEHCSTHCYNPQMRQRIRQVMRYSGPRMLFLHPILTIRHLLESLRT